MTTISKIMPVEQCGQVNKCMASPQSYMDRLPTYGTKSIARAAALALSELEAARARDIALHEANLPAMENNKAIAAQIIAINEAIGMPKRWSELDRNSRSRYPKTIGHDAGYLTDIAREVKTTDGFDHATLSYNQLKVRYDEYSESGKREAEQIERKRVADQQAVIDKRKADMELAAMLLRYELPIESSWEEVLEHLRGKNQRLDLAVAMYQTRCDWSEGAYRVSNALGRFQIENTEDKDIANDVLSCMEDFSDGRVFRDTTWSYDRLFASVEDEQLRKDCQRANEMAGSDE